MLNHKFLLLFFLILFINLVVATDVSTCQELTTPHGVFNLISNLTNGTNCITISGNNITLNGNGYTLFFGQNGTTSQGIKIVGVGPTLIENLSIIMNKSGATNSDGIQIHNGAFGVTINRVNVTISDSTLGSGVYVLGSSNISLNNMTINISANSLYGLELEYDSNLTVVDIKDINIYAYGDNGINVEEGAGYINHLNISRVNIFGNNVFGSDGIRLNVDNNQRYDNVILDTIYINNFNRSDSSSVGIFVDAYFFNGEKVLFKNINITNCSFGVGLWDGDLRIINGSYLNEIVYNQSVLTRQFWNNIIIKDELNNWINNVNVTAKNTTNNILFSRLSDSNGLVSVNTTYYINYSDNTTFFTYDTNYTINASKSGYDDNITSGYNFNNNVLDTLIITGIGSPSITLDYPLNFTYFNFTSLSFNFTATDPTGVNTCELWGNWTNWHKNETFYPTSGVQVNTSKQISDGNYIWNVWCNDSNGLGNFSDNNYSFIIDTTKPLIQESQIDITTTPGSQTVNFNVTGFTERNCNKSWFSVYDSLNNIENSLENISLTSCNFLNTTFVVAESPPSSFTLRVYMNDSVGNENYTEKSFSITASGGTGGGGGGSVSLVTVIALKQINGTLEKTGLDRAKLYSSIRKYCNLYSLYENTCKLSSEDFSNLSNDLEKKNVDINEYLLLDYIKYFDENKVEEVKLEESIVEQFELFKATLEILKQPLIISGVIDKFWFINLVGNEVEIIVRPNKPLKSCQVIGEIGWSCNFTNSFATLSYKLPNSPDFSFRRITAQVSFTSDDGENVFKDAQLRAIYFTTKQLFIYGFSLLSIIALTGLIFRKKIKINYLKNKFKKIW